MSIKLTGSLIVASFTAFPNTYQDNEANARLASIDGTTTEAKRVVRLKFPPEMFKAYNSVVGEMRAAVNFYTVPWVGNQRLLTQELYAPLHDKIDALNTKRVKVLEETIVSRLHDFWIPRSKEIHGETWEASDYPNETQLRLSFSFKLTPTPIPTTDGFKDILDPIVRADMEKKYKSLLDTQVKAATADVWTRLLEPVAHIANVLNDPDKRVFSSIIENVQKITDVAEQLNITGNSAMGQAIHTIKSKILSIDLDSVRESETARKEAANLAIGVIQSFGSYAVAVE